MIMLVCAVLLVGAVPPQAPLPPQAPTAQVIYQWKPWHKDIPQWRSLYADDVEVGVYNTTNRTYHAKKNSDLYGKSSDCPTDLPGCCCSAGCTCPDGGCVCHADYRCSSGCKCEGVPAAKPVISRAWEHSQPGGAPDPPVVATPRPVSVPFPAAWGGPALPAGMPPPYQPVSWPVMQAYQPVRAMPMMAQPMPRMMYRPVMGRGGNCGPGRG